MLRLWRSMRVDRHLLLRHLLLHRLWLPGLLARRECWLPTLLIGGPRIEGHRLTRPVALLHRGEGQRSTRAPRLRSSPESLVFPDAHGEEQDHDYKQEPDVEDAIDNGVPHGRQRIRFHWQDPFGVVDDEAEQSNEV
jgi:hypothetical protein